MIRILQQAKKWGVSAVLGAVMLSLFPMRVAYSQEEANTAGETRAGHVAAQQAQKSKTVRAPQPDKAEALVRRVERIFLEDPSGFYPYFASVYHGGGLTLGAGYRKFYGDNTSWNIKGLYSFKNYKLMEAGTESKDHLQRRLSFGPRQDGAMRRRWDYYGLGIQSSRMAYPNFVFRRLTRMDILCSSRSGGYRSRAVYGMNTGILGKEKGAILPSKLSIRRKPRPGWAPIPIISTRSWARHRLAQSPGYTRRVACITPHFTTTQHQRRDLQFSAARRRPDSTHSAAARELGPGRSSQW